MSPADPHSTDMLSTLQHVLASASRITQDLVGDSLLPRLLDVFSRMPPEDREIVLNVIEREVDLRNLSKDAHRGPMSGVTVAKPNPNARLYLRIADSDPGPYIAPEEIIQAVIRASRVVHRSLKRGSDMQSDVQQVWGPAMVEGLRRLEPAERTTLHWLHRTILDLIDQSERNPDLDSAREQHSG